MLCVGGSVLTLVDVAAVGRLGTTRCEWVACMYMCCEDPVLCVKYEGGRCGCLQC